MWRRVSCKGGALQVCRFVFALALAAVLGGVLGGAPPAQASEATITVTTTPETNREKKLRRTREAEAARIGAEARAINQLGYPRVYDIYVGGSSPSVDVYALSNQIARLAAHIQVLSQRAVGATIASGAAPGAPSLSLPAIPAGNSLAGYGPEGPTGKSVRLILEYRLMVAGNPRLKIGKVNVTKDKVTAQVVTTGGALVEEYSIDKKSGAWTPIR